MIRTSPGFTSCTAKDACGNSEQRHQHDIKCTVANACTNDLFARYIQKHTDTGESAYRNDGKMLQQFQQLSSTTMYYNVLPM